MEPACPRWIGVAAREGTGVMRVSKLIAVTEAACSRTILVPLRDAACHTLSPVVAAFWAASVADVCVSLLVVLCIVRV